jgi:hypothetical protein
MLEGVLLFASVEAKEKYLREKQAALELSTKEELSSPEKEEPKSPVVKKVRKSPKKKPL